ncbi:hypothetical protein cyc_03202 [Cyclospora cayetanensis]|uniref:Uncharacterized protein n=1 Tax=Cyclospora cayetanensis TaxID=88456 RepID=A0A1D3D9K2_9EIME|nr:hypothetical protein cyc_03202 [Cyclospora cayetanensis]
MHHQPLAYGFLRMQEIAAWILTTRPETALNRRVQVEARGAKGAAWETRAADRGMDEAAVCSKRAWGKRTEEGEEEKGEEGDKEEKGEEGDEEEEGEDGGGGDGGKQIPRKSRS